MLGNTFINSQFINMDVLQKVIVFKNTEDSSYNIEANLSI